MTVIPLLARPPYAPLFHAVHRNRQLLAPGGHQHVLAHNTALAADGQQAWVTRGQAAELLDRLSRGDYLAGATADLGGSLGFRDRRWEAGALRKPLGAWEDGRCEEYP